MQINLEKRTDVKGKVSDFIFLVALIHSVECTAVNSYEDITAIFGGTCIKSRSHFILEEKTTSLKL